jgi:3-hydroxybutyryl-CoA dehydrogenase
MAMQIGVVGSGTMGAGIAQISAQAGFEVILIDKNLELARAGLARIEAGLSRLVQKEKLTETDAKNATDLVTLSDQYSDLAEAPLVIEAVYETVEAKRAVIEAVGRVAKETSVFATNTSSISITQLASFHPRPACVVGMHFFNPVPLMPLIELIRAEQSSPQAVEFVRDLASQLGKTAIEVADSPGFVANRILMPMINEAILILEAGVATSEAIDETMKLGANHPMGPLALADLIGLDVVLSITEVLHRDLGEDKYRPAVTLRRMVAAGKLGRKSGEGFYVYG